MSGGRADETREALLHDYERLDDLQRSGLVIIQNPAGFRFSMDAVLLAEFATVRPRDRAIDLGTGTGVIPPSWSGPGDSRRRLSALKFWKRWPTWRSEVSRSTGFPIE